VNGVPAQDLPENQDKDVRYTMLHATGQRIELDEKGEPTVKIGSDGFPVDDKEAEKAETVESPDRAKMPKAKNFSAQAKRDQSLDGHGHKRDQNLGGDEK